MSYPVLFGCLVTGVIFVGVALASQSAPAEVSAPTRVEPTPTAQKPVLHTALDRSRPVTIDIRAIGVHSVLNRVGLDDEGAILTPSGARYDEAAWYKHSPTPGSIGPAIVLGHVDSAESGPSVFFRLGELAAGDRVSITRADGSVARFIVESTRRYPKDGFPTDVVYGDTDHAALRLITCGGSFDDRSGHYEDNIVVFARLDRTTTI